MRYPFVIAFVVCVVATASLVFADPTLVDVSYSHRQILVGVVPDTTMVEASIIATFSANNPISLLAPDSSMTRINSSTFEYLFVWNWNGVKYAEFVDDQADTVSAVAWPQPVYPFAPVDYTVPVMHIHTDSTSLWDPEIGIYVLGNHENFLQHGEEWERQCLVEYFDANNARVLSESIGLRINGNWSRRNHQKGLRLYFDDYGTSDQVVYDFFGGGATSFRRLILRTSAAPVYCLNSNIVEGLFMDLGHLGSRMTPTILFLNGEYWGYYSLRERWDDEFVEHTHELAADDYVLIRDGQALHGDAAGWWEFRDSFSEIEDHTSHEWYVEVDQALDLQNYIDWQFLNIFVAPRDNGGALNLVILKLGDGKWRYHMWDEDGAFPAANLNTDYFRFFSAGSEAEFEEYYPATYSDSNYEHRRYWFAMLNSLMQNSEFKARFSRRVDELLAGPVSVESLTARIHDLVDVQLPEIERHYERWPGYTIWGYLDWADDIANFVAQRHPIVTAQKDLFMEHFRVPVELSEFAATAVGDGVELTWRTESESDNRGFVVYRSIGTPDAMMEIASYLTASELEGQIASDTPTEYAFSDVTAVSGELNYYQLHHVDVGDRVTECNWIEFVSLADWSDLVVNELMADNATTITDSYGDHDDWFELYNAGGSAIHLDGFFVTDDLMAPMKHIFTGGMTVPAGGYLLLWADNETAEEGPAHCGFKLDKDGEVLAIFAPDGQTLIDVVEFGEQVVDISYERFPDGSPDWSHACFATPGGTNVTPATEMALRLNEILADNVTTLTDEMGEYDPWLELYNPLPVSIEMSGLSLSNNPSTPELWELSGATIPAHGYLVVWADSEVEEGPLHACFSLAAEGGFLGLFTLPGGVGVDLLNYNTQFPDVSYARMADGVGPWDFGSTPTPGESNSSAFAAPTLVINEFLASNASGIVDEQGEYEDWVEIYNFGTESVNLCGLYLTDDLSDTARWEFPETSVAAGGFLVVWCDNDPADGPLHAEFKLGASGEEIGLFDRMGSGNGMIDSYVFGPQATDVSEGRETDGGQDWVFFVEPSPGATNAIWSGAPGQFPTALRLGPNYPNPFNPSTRFDYSLPARTRVQLGVFDVRGRLVASLVDELLPAGYHTVTWNGCSRDGAYVASGTYLARLVAGSEAVARRITLLK